MNKLPLFLSLVLAGISIADTTFGQKQPDSGKVLFRDFSGVCQGYDRGQHLKEFIGWERDDIVWHELEPEQGQWNQEYLEEWGKRVLALKAQGIKFLPILCYSAPWARALSIDKGNERIEIRPQEGGKAEYVTFKKDAKGKWVEDKTEIKDFSVAAVVAKEHLEDWEKYVRRVVEFFRAEPYNIEYFQIWNEAHLESGFWVNGTMKEYMERIHLPTAKIVRELGGKVVYGGWPCCGSVKEYVDLLDQSNAWDSVDVHDVHYFPVSAFEYIKEAAKKRGKDSISLWQTELGFTKNPSFIGNSYPRFLAWGLKNDWSHPDKYKLFYFAAWSPDDPKAYGYKCNLMLGDKLNSHGLSLRTLAQALDGPLSLYKGRIEGFPVLHFDMDERKSSIEAFKVGNNKIVLAVHLIPNTSSKMVTDWDGSLDSFHVDFKDTKIPLKLPDLKAAEVAGIRRIDLAGNAVDLTLTPTENGTVTVNVPTMDGKESESAAWFEESGIVTFLLEIKLK